MSNSGLPKVKTKTRPRIPHALWYDEESGRQIPVILMSDIRVLDDDIDGTQLEALSRDFIQIYDPEIHTDLLCPCSGCGARLQVIPYNPLTEQAEHWKSRGTYVDETTGERVKSKHNINCDYKPIVSYNPDAPFRLEVDFSQFADPKSSETMFHHGTLERERYNAKHPALKDQFEGLSGRQTIKLHKPAHLIELIMKGEFSRIKDAFVSSDYGRFEEKDVIVRYTRNPGRREERFLRLLDRLNKIPEGNHLPVFMEFQIDRGTADRAPAKNTSITSHKIFMYQEDGHCGPKHFIVPRAIAIPETSRHVRDSCAHDTRFIMAGLVKMGEVVEADGVVLHHIDIEIRSPEQIMPFDIDGFLPKKQLGLELEP